MLSDAIFTEIIVLVYCNTTRLYIRPILSSPMSYLNGSTLHFGIGYEIFSLIAVGFCGSLTTMSSFALETTNLIDSRQFYTLALNILSNIGLSIGAVYAERIISSVVLF